MFKSTLEARLQITKKNNHTLYLKPSLNSVSSITFQCQLADSLENAKKYLDEKKLFYETLETCITGFLTTKFNFKNTDLVTESIKQELTKIGVDKNTIQDLLKILNTCQYFKFTPNLEFDTRNDYKKSVELIMKLQNFKL